MANLKDIKKRIGSVKNTQKITRAMKMVAAARLRTAQERITALRPYAIKTMELLSSVAARVDDDGDLHPLLERREEKTVLLVVLTSNRGLAGGFNAVITKQAIKLWKQLEEEGKTVEFATIGKKGDEFLSRRGANIVRNFNGVLEDLNSQSAAEVGRYLIDRYVGGEVDSTYLIYNEFKSAMTQIVRSEPMLPVQTADVGEDAAGDLVFEPDEKGLLERLLPMYVETQTFRALLDSVASEHGARMTAMDNATRNAADMIDKLTLKYNRARQAAITTELMEIIGGAEALKG
jgi:F-type H+-transporting ATPase subunit gamma